MSVQRTTLYSARQGNRAQNSRIWRTEDLRPGYMTDWQRERMQPATFTEDRPRGEHPLVSLALWIGVIAVAALLWAVFA